MISFSRFKTTHTRTLVAAGITVLMLLGAGIGAVIFEERSYRSQKIANVDAQTKMLALIVSAALAFNNEEELQEYLAALATSTDIRAVAIYDAAGNTAAKMARATEPPATLKSIFPPMLSDNALVVTSPVEQRGMTIGYVYVNAEFEPLKRRLALYTLIIIMSAVSAFFVLALVLAYMMQRSVALELQRRADMLSQANSELLDQIAAREKSETALRHAYKMEALGKMTGGVAHDFNNLLHVLKLNLTSISWSPATEADPLLREAVATCVKTVDRGATLTRQLLAFGRRQPLSLEPCDINSLLDQVQNLIYPVLGTAIKFRLEKLSGSAEILADPHQFENAILNLAINARDAMPNGGELAIVCHQIYVEESENLPSGDYVSIQVKDNGSGIPTELLDKVFEPFFTTKTVGKGSGLGLSQVYGYIKQVSGDIAVDSVLGDGTCFTLLLPITSLKRKKKIEMVESNESRSMTILIVEDEPAVLHAAAHIITRAGLRVALAQTADEALEILNNRSDIDVLFSDIVLPGKLNGFQLAVQTNQRWPAIKILLTSGYIERDILEVEELQRYPLLRKPYGADELRAEILNLSILPPITLNS